MSQSTAVNRHLPIPERLNLALCGLLQFAAWAGIAWGSRSEGWQLAVSAVGFSFLMLTNYALLHEAAHHVAHPDARINRAIGVLCGALFPVSFSLYRAAHIAHHCSNKTDLEMFDYYYPDDAKLLKFSVWYLILLGPNWLLLPIGSLLLPFIPRLMRKHPFLHMATTPRLAMEFDDPAVMRGMRIDSALVMLYWLALSWLFEPSPLALAAFYACFAFNWSTRQYLTHAFAPREVIDGAHNLCAGPLMRAILLNGNLDLVHHQRPHLAWIHLPKFTHKSRAAIDPWRLYLRMWAGPRPNVEAAPQPLPKE